MKNKWKFFIFVVFVFSACQNNEKKQDLFTRTIHVESEIFISADNLQDPRFLAMSQEHLIVGNYKKSPLIEIYDLSSGRLRNSFLNAGKGPWEILTIGNVQIIPHSKELLISDLWRKRLLKYKLDDILTDSLPNPDIVFERSEKSSLLFDKLYTGKDFFIAESRDPRGRILLMDKDEKEIGYYLKYPDKERVDKELSDIHNATLYTSAMTINPSLDKMALAAYNAGMLDILRIQGNEVVSVWNYADFYPQEILVVPMGNESAVAFTQNSRTGFLSTCCTDAYVYALFSGKLIKDKTYRYGHEVFVVNWDGNETFKIILDRPVSRITVDSNDKTLYGITPDMDIVKFDIR